MKNKITTYGFDSYNQDCIEEVLPTLRAGGGGEQTPKIVIISDEDSDWHRPLQPKFDGGGVTNDSSDSWRQRAYPLRDSERE